MVMQVLFWLLLSLLYTVGGVVVATVRFRQATAKNARQVLADDTMLGVFFTGLFWLPVGLGVITYSHVTAPKLVKPDDGMTKAQRERKRRLEQDRIDLSLDVMQHQNEQAELAFHQRRIKEIEARSEQ